MSHRLLLAVADPDVARRAAALAAEGEGLEVLDTVKDPDEVARALARLDVDVVVLHDELGSVPVLQMAREIAAGSPEVGLVLIAAEDTPEVLRSAMQAGIRDVVSLPLSLEQLEGSVRQAAQWSRTMRERVAGEESAAGAVGGQLVAVAGSKGGVGTTTVAIQLALAAVRASPGRPVCLVDFDLQKGDFRNYLDMPQRRSVVDLVDVAAEISVRHLQETLYTHRDGFRVLLAPEEGERYEEVDSAVARSVLGAVRARHSLTVVDLGASVTEASVIGAEMASKVLVVTTPDVAALRGARRLAALWQRLQVRETDEDVLVLLNRTSRKVEVQPELARKVVRGRFTRTTVPAAFGALEAAVNTGVPSRMEDQKMRAAYGALAAEVDAAVAAGDQRSDDDGDEPRGLLARLGGDRGQSTAEAMGLLPILAVVILGIWQIGLVGYTYTLAGHAAREGARELATDPTDTRKDKPYAKVARADLPKPWRGGAKVRKVRDVTVAVDLAVPIVLPGLRSPFRIKSEAATSVEDEELPDSQRKTPTPTPTPRRSSS